MYKKRYKIDVSRVISTTSSNTFSSISASRKGQVTVFIILGILLLLALLLVVFVRREVVTFKPEEILPTEKGKVESFITSCIDEAGSEALFLIGLQAGYIEVPPRITSDGSIHLRVSPHTVVPYWAYGEIVDIPSLEQIKADIDQYLETHVRECLFAKEAFQEKYELIEKSPLAANTEIVESKVIFNLHWDVEIQDKSGEVITEIINHVAESPVKLRNVYQLAREIVEKEMQTLKLEDITQDLIALEHPDVPVAGMDLSCTSKTWDVGTVRQALLDLLRINIRELKVKDTSFIEFPEELPYYQNHYVWDLGEAVNDPRLGVTFKFDETYPYTFAVTPLSGTKMKSSNLGGSELLSFLCIQTWKFTYDMVYPVLVTVRDDTTGYNFQIAFTVHLVRNEPSRKEAFARPSYILEKATDEDYCAVLNIPMTVKTYELIENKEGIFNRLDLGNVNLSFTCLRYACDIGETDYDFANQGFAGLTQNFPYCAGGIMRGVKRGYKEDWERVVTTPGATIELGLAPLFKFPASNIKVVKHAFRSDLNAPVEDPGTALTNNEIALIDIIYRKDDDFPGTPFHKVEFVKSTGLGSQLEEANRNIGEEDSIEFLARADFTYELDITIIQDELITGGYKANWTIPWEALESADELVFHVLSTGKANEETMFELVNTLGEKSVFVPSPELR